MSVYFQKYDEIQLSISDFLILITSDFTKEEANIELDKLEENEVKYFIYDTILGIIRC